VVRGGVREVAGRQVSRRRCPATWWRPPPSKRPRRLSTTCSFQQRRRSARVSRAAWCRRVPVKSRAFAEFSRSTGESYGPCGAFAVSPENVDLVVATTPAATMPQRGREPNMVAVRRRAKAVVVVVGRRAVGRRRGRPAVAQRRSSSSPARPLRCARTRTVVRLDIGRNNLVPPAPLRRPEVTHR
jgi:hypothetical protein